MKELAEKMVVNLDNGTAVILVEKRDWEIPGWLTVEVTGGAPENTQEFYTCAGVARVWNTRTLCDEVLRKHIVAVDTTPVSDEDIDSFYAVRDNRLFGDPIPESIVHGEGKPVYEHIARGLEAFSDIDSEDMELVFALADAAEPRKRYSKRAEKHRMKTR